MIANPLPPGGNDEDNRGAYLSPGRRLRSRRRRRRLVPARARRSARRRGLARGPVQVTRRAAPGPRAAWPVAVRAPLTARRRRPGSPPGARRRGARRRPGGHGPALRARPGLDARVPLCASGAAREPPARRRLAEPGRAHAVGDDGAMWLWRAETGLWEPTRPRRSASRPTSWASPSSPATRSAGTRSARPACCCATTRPGRQEPLPGRASRPRTSWRRVRRLAGDRGRRRPTCSSTTAAAGTSTRTCGACSRRSRRRAAFVTVAGLPDGGAVAAGRTS